MIVLETCSLHVWEPPTFTLMMETEQVSEMFLTKFYIIDCIEGFSTSL